MSKLLVNCSITVTISDIEPYLIEHQWRSLKGAALMDSDWSMIHNSEWISIKNLANHWIQIDAARSFCALFSSAKRCSDFSFETLVVLLLFYRTVPVAFQKIGEKSEKINREQSKFWIFSVEKYIERNRCDIARSFLSFFSAKTSELDRAVLQAHTDKKSLLQQTILFF